MAGRKTKLNKELIARAEKLLKAGNYDKTVCEYLGIDISSWYRWMQEGECAETGLKKEFYDTIKKAKASAEVMAVTGILGAGQENWQALAWYLERKFPEKWAKKDRDTDNKGTAVISELASAINEARKLYAEDKNETQ